MAWKHFLFFLNIETQIQPQTHIYIEGVEVRYSHEFVRCPLRVSVPSNCENGGQASAKVSFKHTDDGGDNVISSFNIDLILIQSSPRSSNSKCFKDPTLQGQNTWKNTPNTRIQQRDDKQKPY